MNKIFCYFLMIPCALFSSMRNAELRAQKAVERWDQLCDDINVHGSVRIFVHYNSFKYMNIFSLNTPTHEAFNSFGVSLQDFVIIKDIENDSESTYSTSMIINKSLNEWIPQGTQELHLYSNDSQSPQCILY